MFGGHTSETTRNAATDADANGLSHVVVQMHVQQPIHARTHTHTYAHTNTTKLINDVEMLRQERKKTDLVQKDAK